MRNVLHASMCHSHSGASVPHCYPKEPHGNCWRLAEVHADVRAPDLRKAAGGDPVATLAVTGPFSLIAIGDVNVLRVPRRCKRRVHVSRPIPVPMHADVLWLDRGRGAAAHT